ncbi:hypothetical protein [Streptomyces sp. NPDC002845]
MTTSRLHGRRRTVRARCGPFPVAGGALRTGAVPFVHIQAVAFALRTLFIEQELDQDQHRADASDPRHARNWGGSTAV